MRCIISEYSVVEVVFKDEGCLLQSLKDLGYKPVVHNDGITLHNNYSKSSPTAHIIVSKEQYGGYGDIGFERTKQGFQMHVDGGRFKIKKLNQTYIENRVKKHVNSTSNYSVISRRENEKGQVEIHLRVGG